MGQGAGGEIDEADRFVLEGIEFVPSWNRPSEPGSLTLLKSRAMVDAYRSLLAPYPEPRMVELGISQGGSVALLAVLARPTTFVAVELAAEPVAPLLAAIDQLGMTDRVKPYFGVDQGDQARLRQILDDEFGDAPLDLVIDDASHRYGPTVASFEVLFARLRPGGVYVIEDWTWEDLWADKMAAVLADPASPQRAALEDVLGAAVREREERQERAEPPISRIALELVLARARSGDAIAEIHIDESWIVVTRGPGALDLDGLTIGDLCPDHLGALSDPGDSPARG